MKYWKRSRKQKKRWMSSFLFLVFFSLFVFGFLISMHYVGVIPQRAASGSSFFHQESPITHTKFSMVMVGDALIHQAVYEDAWNGSVYDFNPMLQEVAPLLSSYDVQYYNQETILGGSELGLSTYPCFNSPYEVGDAFVGLGFNLVSLSTNHTLDRGERAILNSRAYWNKQKNVLATGSYSSFEERNHYVIREVNGITYTMLSYTDTTNGIRTPNGKDYLVNRYSEESVRRDVLAVRDKVDVLFVAMHWGTEYQYEADASQKKIAQYLSSLGVDVVIGTHPHVVEPIEFIGNTMVIYSLGNFISAQKGIERLTGGVVSIDIRKIEVGTTKKVVIENPRATLVYTASQENVSGKRENFRVLPYSMVNDEILENASFPYQSYLKILLGSSGKVKEMVQ